MALKLQSGETFIDATVNNGGHSRALCEALGSGGVLLGVDQDGQALERAKKQLSACPGTVRLAQGNFRHLAKLAAKHKLKPVDAILFDLGLSSEQLSEGGRGFSFQHDGPLKMTLDPEAGEEAVTAYDVVNSWSEIHLADIIRGFGEESFAQRIAERIVATRRYQPVKTTGQLVEIIRQALPGWYKEKRLHFATKTFQAIRLAVNDELGALKEGLAEAWNLLKSDGRLVVISFHSLEAREVKKFFQAKVKAKEGSWKPRHAIKASREEVLNNPRARSAQLRIITKV